MDFLIHSSVYLSFNHGPVKGLNLSKSKQSNFRFILLLGGILVKVVFYRKKTLYSLWLVDLKNVVA